MEAAEAIRELSAQRQSRGFERDCERLRPLGEAFVLRRFGGALNRADAEDAVSDVIFRLHRRMTEGRPPDNLRATFFTSVRNAAIDQLRSRAAKPTVALDAAADAATDGATPPERAESSEDAVRLQEALRRMRGNYREAIVLRFGLGLTVPEIARHLQISLPAAKKLVLRATHQVKKRLEAIEDAEFCPEMRDLARRSLFEKHASGLASEAEAEILRMHFKHCGSCKSFLASLHDTLHEFGSSVLLAGAATDQLDGKVGVLDHLARWAADATHGVQAGSDKVRLAAFKTTGAFQSTDAGAAGALAGTGQKIVAICGAGAATTAACLATGVVGPGIGTAPPVSSQDPPPAQVKTIPDPLPVLPPPVPVTDPAPDSAADQTPQPDSSPASAPAPPPTPAQQSQAEFGIESSPSSSPAPAPAPAPASSPAPSSSPTPSSSSSSGSGSGGGGSSGSESFGFHG